MLKDILDNRSDLQRHLYVRGYLISDTMPEKIDEYPFYGNWVFEKVYNYYFGHHKEMNLHLFKSEDCTYFLFGHAYNPFSMEYREADLLKGLSDREFMSKEFWEYEADFTGVYVMGRVSESGICHWGDCTGLLLSYYGVINNHYYCCSHSKLLSDICGLQEDPYVTRLINYKHYHFYGTYLPGNISSYKELKRCVPNHYYMYENGESKHARFYPQNVILECTSNEEYNNLVDEVSDTMKKTMHLCAQKWPDQRSAISVTGGRDSGMTLASAVDDYDKFKYFSYISVPKEAVDAEAAQKICKALGLEHILYKISNEDADFKDIEIYRDILEYNSGCIGGNNKNDVRKRVYFLDKDDFDVEIKSWVGEIGRERYSKRYLKRKFPRRPTPRYCTTLYKVFFEDRKLVRDTDAIFREYIKDYLNEEDCSKLDWQNLFYWEFSWGSGEGVFMTGEQLFAYDITVPYNNRHLVNLLLQAPRNYRYDDKLQQDVVIKNNSELENLGIHIVDVNHTHTRAKIERVYLELHTRFPF